MNIDSDDLEHTRRPPEGYSFCVDYSPWRHHLGKYFMLFGIWCFIIGLLIPLFVMFWAGLFGVIILGPVVIYLWYEYDRMKLCCTTFSKGDVLFAIGEEGFWISDYPYYNLKHPQSISWDQIESITFRPMPFALPVLVALLGMFMSNNNPIFIHSRAPVFHCKKGAFLVWWYENQKKLTFSAAGRQRLDQEIENVFETHEYDCELPVKRRQAKEVAALLLRYKEKHGIGAV